MVNVEYCTECKKEVETRWSYGRMRCIHCKTALDKNPMNLGAFSFVNKAKEITQANARQLIERGY